MINISVIIPYHNEIIEIFNKCLESIKNQTYKEFEVIIVDDGSEEEYSRKIRNIVKEEEKVVYFKQENQGVSSARNRGIREAKGSYVTFIDADDIVVPFFLEEAIDTILNNSADILYSYVERTKNEEAYLTHKNGVIVKNVESDWLIGKMIGKEYIFNGMHLGRGPWARLLRIEIARDNPFPIGVPIGEDVLWNLSLLEKNYKKILAECMWYKYMIREGAVTNRYDMNIENKLKPFYNQLLKNENIKQSERRYIYERVLRDLKRYIFDQYLGNSKNPDSFLLRQKKFYDLCKMEPWYRLNNIDCFKIVDIKDKVKWILLKMKLIFFDWTIRSGDD